MQDVSTVGKFHSITSSARASSVGDTSRPSALAVGRLMTNSNLVDWTTGSSGGLAPFALAALRLMTSSYLVGACTGRSAGFSPLKDAIDIAGRRSKLVRIIRTVGNEAAGGDHVTKWIDRRQFVPSPNRSLERVKFAVSHNAVQHRRPNFIEKLRANRIDSGSVCTYS